MNENFSPIALLANLWFVLRNYSGARIQESEEKETPKVTKVS